MSGSPGRKRRDGSSRQAIFDCAVRLFAERGFDGTSLRDIAAAAGTRLSLIDYHFGAKEALFRAVLAGKAAEVATAMDESLDRRLAGSTTGRLDLASIVEAYVEPHWEHAAIRDEWRDYCRLAYGVISRPDRLDLAEPFLAATRRATDRYHAALAEVLPELDMEDLSAAVRLINLSIIGLILHVTSMPQPPTVMERRRRSLVRFCVGGVAGMGAGVAPPTA